MKIRRPGRRLCCGRRRPPGTRVQVVPPSQIDAAKVLTVIVSPSTPIVFAAPELEEQPDVQLKKDQPDPPSEEYSSVPLHASVVGLNTWTPKTAGKHASMAVDPSEKCASEVPSMIQK